MIDKTRKSRRIPLSITNLKQQISKLNSEKLSPLMISELSDDVLIVLKKLNNKYRKKFLAHSSPDYLFLKYEAESEMLISLIFLINEKLLRLISTS